MNDLENKKMKGKNFCKKFIEDVNEVYESTVDENVNWDDPSTIDVVEWNRIAAGDMLTLAIGPEYSSQKRVKACREAAGDEPYDLMMHVYRGRDGRFE